MRSWIDEHEGSGKMEQSWSFAVQIGGGGILNVGSHEELDAIMGGFPFASFSEISVYPLADHRKSLEKTQEMMARMPAQ